MGRRSRLSSLLLWLAAVALIAVALIPIIWIALTAFKTRADIFASPPKLFFEPDFSAFQRLFSSRSTAVTAELVNSLVISIGATLLALLAASLAAYSITGKTCWILR